VPPPPSEWPPLGSAHTQALLNVGRQCSESRRLAMELVSLLADTSSKRLIGSASSIVV
jgi:hypothetical protein